MNAYRQQQLRAAALIESGATAEQVAAVYGWTKSRAAPEPIETGDKRTLTPRRKCGMIKAIKRHISRVKKARRAKTMKKYLVREFRIANDGSEYETERYEITADELEETREGLEELIGTSIDSYTIDEI